MYIDLALILLAFAILLTATVILAVRYTYRRVGLRWRNPFPLIERAPKRDLTIDDLDVEPADTEAIKYLRDLSRKWRVFQDVYLVQRDGTMQIDYLIVSRQGVFLIEAKNWSGTPVGNETDALWTLFYPRGVTKKVKNPIVDLYGKARFLTRTAKIPEGAIHLILSFGSATDMYYLNVYDNVRIVYHQQLVEAINSYPWRSISRRTMKRVIADIKQRSPHGSEKQLEHLRFINRMIDIRSRA